MNRTHRRCLLILSLVAATGIGGCSAPSSANLDVDDDGVAVANSATSAVDRWAVALARTLDDQANRAVVAMALKESNLTEHKVVFKAFLESAEAIPVRQRLAMELGWDDRRFDAELEDLPSLDLYMMAEAHRQAWLPEQPVMVAAAMGQTPPTRAYLGQSREVPLKLADRVLPTTAILFLQAAEYKEQFAVERIPGARTIEARGDRARRVRPARAECDPNTDPNACQGEGGGGGGDPPACNYFTLTRIWTNDLIDNGNPFEGNEIEVHVVSGVSTGSARVTGVMPQSSWSGSEFMLYSCYGGSFTAKETDGILNPDDNFTLQYPYALQSFPLYNGVLTDLFEYPTVSTDSWKLSIEVEW